MTVTLHLGDCIEVMRQMPDNSVDSIVTDPPYGLRFMGKKWDYDVPGEVIWTEALRVLKPGGYLLAFSGTRTQHRMACRIEDAGFEIRDMIAWVYGSGFPKSLDVSKALDKLAGAEREIVGTRIKAGIGGSQTFAQDAWTQANRGAIELDITIPATGPARQWQGYGTALKPALEPITMARKPLIGTVAANVLAHGTGALNIDGCRVETADVLSGSGSAPLKHGGTNHRPFHDTAVARGCNQSPLGRWPANLIHDGSDEVLVGFPDSAGSGPSRVLNRSAKPDQNGWGMNTGGADAPALRDAGPGNAARFFYCAKTSKTDRHDGMTLPGPVTANGATLRDMENAVRDGAAGGNNHPTVKPTSLMAYLCRLVTPPGGTVLDPFMGSGSTGRGAALEGFNFIGIDMTPEYVEIASDRIDAARRSLIVAANDPEPAPMEAANDQVLPSVVQSDLFAGLAE